MRVRLYDVPFLLLLALPLYVTVYDYGVVSTVVAMALWFVVRQVIVFLVAKSRAGNDRVLFETHPLSHYAEKVRWAMDRLNQPYEEQPDVGTLVNMLTGRLVPVLHVPGKNISIENSPDILRYLYGLHCQDEKRSAFLKPTAEAVAMEQKIDLMGANICRYLYYNAVVLPDAGDDNALILWGCHHDAVPAWQKHILKAVFPIAKKYLIHRLELTPEGVSEALQRCKEVFQETDKLLSDGRQFLLSTPEPTYVDMALAALGSILAAPDNFGGKTVNEASRLKMANLSPAMQKEIKAFRSTPTGKHILKMYKEYR